MAHYDCNFCGGGVYEGCAPNCGTLMEKYFAMNRSTNKTPPKYDLSEFVGRRQLPGDEKAFDRVSAAFDQSKIIAPTVKTEPLATPKKIPHISEGGVTYELHKYTHTVDAWAFCRDGEVMRWLNEYEENIIYSVMKACEDYDENN